MVHFGQLRALVAVIALASGIGMLAGATPARAQFMEDFASVDSANSWNNSPGTWNVANGTYGAAPGSAPGGAAFSTLQTAGYTNMTSLTFSFDLLNAADSGGILRSSVDGNDSLVAIFRPSLGDFYFIRRFNSGWQSPISSTSISTSLVGQDVRITMTASNGTYTASAARLDTPNTPFASISATDSSFLTAPATEGRIGLYQFTGASRASRYDNVSVTGVAVVPEANSLALALPALGLVGMVLSRNRRSKANPA